MTPPSSSLPAVGRIDMHCHLLPGVDDGCAVPEETFDCIRRYLEAGFVGCICTPHVIPDLYPNNTRDNIRQLVAQLQEDVSAQGLDFKLWPGGELRAQPGLIDWLKAHGVPTLADSRCVLVDFWAEKWPSHVIELFDWLLSEKYQPILAHPERIKCCCNDQRKLADVVRMGVWLQGNTKPCTGSDGYQAMELSRQLLAANQYRFLATDNHRPFESMEARLDGMQLIAAQFGDELVDRLMSDHPRTLLKL